VATYLALCDFSAPPFYIEAGQTCTDTGPNKNLPTGWTPNPSCVDPLDNDALNAFYAVGPIMGAGGIVGPGSLTPSWPGGSRFNVAKPKPHTYWVPVPNQPGFFKLTGMGASLQPVQGDFADR
jgi:hypothetical protein